MHDLAIATARTVPAEAPYRQPKPWDSIRSISATRDQVCTLREIPKTHRCRDKIVLYVGQKQSFSARITPISAHCIDTLGHGISGEENDNDSETGCEAGTWHSRRAGGRSAELPKK